MAIQRQSVAIRINPWQSAYYNNPLKSEIYYSDIGKSLKSISMIVRK